MSPRRKATNRRPRREKGSGSITSYPTRTGLRWRYATRIPVEPGHPEAGTRIQSCAGFVSYEDADEALTLVRADVIRKIPQAVGRDTFTPYARRWLDGHSVGNGTRMYIKRVIDAMDPYIGNLQVTDIRATDLAAAYRGLERGTKQPSSAKRHRKGLATSTVARYANWVNTIFLAALDEGLIVKNPANSKHAGRPKGESAKRVKPFVIWDVEELTRFCDWALAEDEAWATAWVIFARTGLRSGELLALRWGDIDFGKRQMRIERALHYDETLAPGERYVIGPVKGGRPRTISFDATCERLLQNWRRDLPLRLVGGADNVTPLHGLRADDPIFPSRPGRAATQSSLHSCFLRLQRDYRRAHPEEDLPRLTVHELRHTHASLLFEAGQSVKVVQERLGHASAQVTLNTYAHLLHDAQSRAAAALEELLSGGPGSATSDDSAVTES